jgi:hypothetical protein
MGWNIVVVPIWANGETKREPAHPPGPFVAASGPRWERRTLRAGERSGTRGQAAASARNEVRSRHHAGRVGGAQPRRSHPTASGPPSASEAGARASINRGASTSSMTPGPSTRAATAPATSSRSCAPAPSRPARSTSSTSSSGSRTPRLDVERDARQGSVRLGDHKRKPGQNFAVNSYSVSDS